MFKIILLRRLIMLFSLRKRMLLARMARRKGRKGRKGRR
jgi:hypothetical protein